jgi:paraquat-inducible protein A
MLACPECDLLQREPPAAEGPGTLDCPRCGAILERRIPRSLELCTSFSVTAGVLFAIGASFPVMTLELQGRWNSVSLFGVATALHAEGMTSVALLVLVTIVAMPALEIAALLYMLVPVVVLGRVPRQLGFASRLLEAVKPWAMLEVLMLAAIACIPRLEKVGPLTLGPAFWSLAAMMVLFALIDSTLEMREVWDRAAWVSR